MARYKRRTYRFTTGRGAHKQTTVKRFKLSPYNEAYNDVSWERVPGSRGRYYQGRYRGHNVYITRHSYRKLGNVVENFYADWIREQQGLRGRTEAKQTSAFQIFREAAQESRPEAYSAASQALDAEQRKALVMAAMEDAVRRSPGAMARVIAEYGSFQEYYAQMVVSDIDEVRDMLDETGTGGVDYVDPFTGESTNFEALIEDEINPAWYRKKE